MNRTVLLRLTVALAVTATAMRGAADENEHAIELQPGRHFF